jgi:hypothetical protein
MPSESVCQVALSWVGVGSFHARLVVRFMIFTASVRNILDTPLYWTSCTFVPIVVSLRTLALLYIGRNVPLYTIAVVPCISRRAQSGRRTSFWRQAELFKSHIVLAIF